MTSPHQKISRSTQRDNVVPPQHHPLMHHRTTHERRHP